MSAAVLPYHLLTLIHMLMQITFHFWVLPLGSAKSAKNAKKS